MSIQPTARKSAPRRFTSSTITAGVIVAAACYIIAGVAEVAGVESGSGKMTDLGAVFDGLLTFTPWAWATLGTYAVVVTPILGLIVTAYEYTIIADRRTVSMAIAVIVVLMASAVIAVLR